MEVVNKNLRYLRKRDHATQQEFADKLGVKRASIGAYEEGRAKPNIDVLKKLSKKYHISLDWLLTKDLTKLSTGELKTTNQADV